MTHENVNQVSKLLNSIAGLMFCSLLLGGCEKMEYSPYQTKSRGPTASMLNHQNLQKIKSGELNADDTVTVLYSGDSQRFYDELERLVLKVNTLKSVDFFILCGDIADFVILQEYLWIHERLERLNVPYLCAIGNHDFAANKGEIYTSMFGEKNFSFTYKKYKFLFHDTNSREYNFNGKIPDMNWLRTQVQDSSNWLVAVSHVPPFDVDFDRNLEIPYKDLFASQPKMIASLHGHLHGNKDLFFYDDHVRYMTSNAVEKSEFILLKFIHGNIIKQTISY